MAQLVIRLEGFPIEELLPDVSTREGIDAAIAEGRLYHLKDDAEIMIGGLEHGMASGAPSVMLGFKLPDGRAVFAETSFRLLATAFHALAGRFGTAYPDLQEMELIHDGQVGAGKMKYQIVADDKPQFMECQVCGERKDFPPPSIDRSLAPQEWLYRHFRAKHPTLKPPYSPPPDEDWDS